MRSTRTKKILATAVVGVAAAAMYASPAQAVVTATQFTLSGGGVSISTSPANATLNSAATGAAALTGSLGSITVTDARGALVTGWSVTGESTDFTTDADSDGTRGNDAGETVPDDNVLYTGVGTPSGVVTPVGSAAVAIADTVTVMAGTAVVGNNSVTWNPTIAITLPSNAVAGTYQGTITHSVV